MCKTIDRTRFTFRMTTDIDNYLNNKTKVWRTSKSSALIRIILEYAKEHGEEIELKEEV